MKMNENLNLEDMKNLLEEIMPIVEKYVMNIEDVIIVVTDVEHNVHSASTCDKHIGIKILEAMIRTAKAEIALEN